MKNIKNSVYVISLLLVFQISGINSRLFAQQDHTTYLLECVPQSNYSNPAFTPTYNWYITFPGLSSFYTEYINTGFSIDDMITRRSDDSLIIDKDKILSSLDENNNITLNLHEELIGFGFRIKKNYFFFSTSSKTSAQFNYSKELFSLLLNGNAQYIGKNVNLGGVGLDVNNYVEFAVGMSREINDKLSVGAKIKYLIGIANINTEKSEINLYTGTAQQSYAMTASTDILINTSSPVDLNIDGEDNDDSEFDFDEWRARNTGYGIDLGATYKLNKKISFAASILDLGSITWKEDVSNYRSKEGTSTFTFEGVNIGDFFNKGELSDTAFNSLLDSIQETFKLEEVNETYKTSLNTKFYISGHYSLTEVDKLGVLVRGEFFNKEFYPSLSISYNRQFGRVFIAVVNWTIMNKIYTNLGLGFAFNPGPVQLYMVSDNVYSVFDPNSTRNINFRFGMNFRFGRNIDKKVVVIEEEEEVE